MERVKNFMHMEWSEEKFLKGIVGDKTRLLLWNKHQKIELVFTQLAPLLEKLARKQNVSSHKLIFNFSCLHLSIAC